MSRKKVLIVEDERITAEDIKQTLESLGYEICNVVSNGEEAIKQAEKLKPDLVLMDIVLKGKISGIEAAEKISSDLNIPVIYLTAYADEATLQQAKLTAPLGYIVKPFTERDLRTAIEIALYRAEMEKKLKEQKEWFYTILKSIGDGVISTDTNGNIIFMNPVAEKLTCWKKEEAIGLPLEKVFYIIKEETGEVIKNFVQKVVEKGTTVNLRNILLVNKQGEKIPIDNSGAPIKDDKGNLLGVVIIFRDISQKKALEEELLKRSKLEAIGFLAGGIAHDFNNILTAILGNIELAKVYLQSKSLDRLSEKLIAIEKTVLQAKQIVQEILAFAKGGLPIKKTTSIAKVLHETANLATQDSNVSCEVICPENLWLVEIDEAQIAQVINNLIINAIQAMPQGGTIKIIAENVYVDETTGLPLKPGRYVKITVRDQGIGIPKEHLDKIFDPFFTTKPNGSGLGLAVVYFIIKNHDGYITVESEPGEGTTFYIYLPASQENLSISEEGPETIIKGKGRILVMDDEEIVREVLGELLKQLGYEPAFAANGEEAIAMYKKAKEEGKPFNMVIMDLVIPGGMGGKETIEELIKIDPEVKAIASSGYSDDPIMTNYQKYGFKGVIAKPYTLADLSKILSQVS